MMCRHNLKGHACACCVQPKLTHASRIVCRNDSARCGRTAEGNYEIVATKNMPANVRLTQLFNMA